MGKGARRLRVFWDSKAIPSKKKLKQRQEGAGLSIPWTREASREPYQPTAKIGQGDIRSEMTTLLPFIGQRKNHLS